MAPLFANFSCSSSGKGMNENLLIYNGSPNNSSTLDDTFSIENTTQYAFALNTSFKAVLEYAYNNSFTLGLGYKISTLNNY